MLGSRSKYFNKSKDELYLCRSKLKKYLLLWDYSYHQMAVYLKAFDYFCKNPDDFDGATLAKDLCHIPGLDINAMLHDYHYVTCNAGASFESKWLADWIFAKQMEKLGKAYIAWIRFAELKITGVFWIPYARLKRGETLHCQKVKIKSDMDILFNG